ncbi:MAG: diacylglycerol kinase, catalytic region [Myxococcaceae bacterium]|nr:diacylglycerol kinase, catalytic region [Myxococcaceae bacterium]
MQTKRIKIIVNPSARSGRAWKALRQASAPPPGVQLEWVESRGADHLTQLVRAAQDEDLHALGLAGGDGTVTHALAGIAGRNRVPIGLLPVGSGNDFAFNCSVPKAIAQALALLTHGTPRRVDLARCGATRRFCCVAGVGLDEMALRIIYGSWLPRSKGLNIYAALRALATYRPPRVRISWEGGGYEGEVMFAAVTNTTSYGGGFMVTPAARIDDGALDLCIVKRTGRVRLLTRFPRILKGTHTELDEVIIARSPWVRIEADGAALPVPLDGELGMAQTPVELRCDPGGLTLLGAPVLQLASGLEQQGVARVA